MKKTTKPFFHDRKSERGAALVTTILVSTLLLTIAGTVILTTALSATTAFESTSELQAYYGAESGLEATLNVLRGNVAPRPGMPNNAKIGFRGAVDSTTSNLPQHQTQVARLSGWLPYGNDNRVSPAGVNYSYSVAIIDPDDPNGTTRAGNAAYTPNRLVVRSTGFGPHGSIKRMEMVVQKTAVDIIPAAMLLMRGAEDCGGMNFSIGNSNAKTYTGQDNAHAAPALPTFGVTCGGDVAVANAGIEKPETVADVKVGEVGNDSLPSFLQDADTAREFLNYMQGVSRSMGRYYTSFTGNAGTDAHPAVTFVNGNCDLSGGAGLLIVTGDLTLSGNPNFNGIILALGNGNVIRNGGGSGNILGAIFVARFARSWPASENGQEHPFLPPTFQTNGGGNSDLKYDSEWVQKAKDTMGTIIRDIREF